MIEIGDHKEGRRHQNDRRPRRDIQIKTRVHPDETAKKPDHCREKNHLIKTVGDQPGGHGRNDDRRGDHRHPHHLHRNNNRRRQDQREKRFDPSRRNSVNLCDLRVECRKEKLPVEDKNKETGDYRHRADRPEILRRHAENISEERRLKVLRKPPVLADDRHADGKARGGHHADRRVGADFLLSRHHVDQQRREKTPQTGAEIKIPTHHIADDRPAEHRVREAVTDVAHPPQDDIDAEETADRADERGGDQPVNKKFILERRCKESQLDPCDEGWVCLLKCRPAFGLSSTRITSPWRTTDISDS